MTEAATPWKSPYTPDPGTSTAAPDVDPRHGISSLKLFFWMSLLNTTIIGSVGVVAWWYVTH